MADFDHPASCQRSGRGKDLYRRQGIPMHGRAAASRSPSRFSGYGGRSADFVPLLLDPVPARCAAGGRSIRPAGLPRRVRTGWDLEVTGRAVASGRPILVVGGGIAGLALALSLARHGRARRSCWRAGRAWRPRGGHPAGGKCGSGAAAAWASPNGCGPRSANRRSSSFSTAARRAAGPAAARSLVRRPPWRALLDHASPRSARGACRGGSRGAAHCGAYRLCAGGGAAAGVRGAGN